MKVVPSGSERAPAPGPVSPMRIYDAVLSGLALISGLMLAFIFVSIVYDVIMRTIGFYPPVWTASVAEYGLLYLTVLAAPWLLRHHGHVSVGTFLGYMPPRVRKFLMRLACIVGALTCGIFAFFALKATLTIVGYDIRSFAVPRWVVLAAMPVGFVLLSVEFLRQAITADFKTDKGEH